MNLDRVKETDMEVAQYIEEELERQQKEFENQLGGNFVNTMITEAMKMPEVRQQITQGMSAAKKKR